MPLLSDIVFGSYFVYSPKGSTPISQKSRFLRDVIKFDRYVNAGTPLKLVRGIPHLISLMKNALPGSDLEGFCTDQPILVPAPRSAPVAKDSLYPTKLICQNMVACQLGRDFQPVLERAVPVPKAAFQRPEARPTVQTHFASLKVSKELGSPSSILVVDDVVTSGSMLLACVSKLQESYPDSQIRAFALLRTMSGVEVESLVSMCVGTIRPRGERATRVP
jgi:hypothetical protein